MINYEFVIDTPPDEELIERFHDNLAKMMIKKYGEETMKEVLRQIGVWDEKA